MGLGRKETTLEGLKESVKEALDEEAEEYKDFEYKGDLAHEIADEYAPIYKKEILEVLNNDRDLMDFKTDLEPTKETVFEISRTVIFKELRGYAYKYIEDNTEKFDYLKD